MSALKPKLPNMNALLPFEAAGRWLSFTRAAEELCVTQGAVSRQIRELELSLGVALFRRGHRSIELTDDGRRYHHAVTVALEHLVDATGDVVARPSERQVTVAATSAISIYWLMPLLPHFQSMFPDITVQVLASDTSLASAPDAFDIGIQFGHGRWPAMDKTFLRSGEAVPVCSPGFLAGRVPFLDAADLLEQPLLQLADTSLDWVSWPAWFRAAGVDAAMPDPALRLNTYALLNKAAFEGAGIALGLKPLLGEQFERGWLTVACDIPMQTEFSFYLMTPSDKPLSQDGCIVRDWIISEFRKPTPI
jgi:DNA-binding transcriptional LysR family regulator